MSDTVPGTVPGTGTQGEELSMCTNPLGTYFDSHIQENGIAEPDAPEGYRVGAMTIFPKP